MEQQNFTRRVVTPALAVLIVMVGSWILYDQAWRIGSHAMHQRTAYLAGILLFLSIGFGPLYVYPRAFFRGASLGERILASLVTPVAWNAKEILGVSEVFTWGESLYYGLNPVFFMCLSVAAVQMGLCEMVCRRLRNRGVSEPAPVVTPTPLVAVVVGLVCMAVLLLWDMGAQGFYIFQEGYKALFT
jgi:hypothetical protein